MAKIDLIQPRHNYAPVASEEKFGHIYLPTSLLTAGAVLQDAGIDVNLHDENLSTKDITSRYVGINLLGAPYIPEAIKLQNQIRQETGNETTFFLGGKVIDSLTDDQFLRLFGDDSLKGNDLGLVSRVIGGNKQVQSPLDASLIPIYKKIPDEIMKEYLSREISFFVSKGCSSVCDFCAADKGMPETYRDQHVLKNDLSYLVGRAKGLGLNSLSIYMCNLDVFQTPQELKKFATAICDIKKENSGFEIYLRGLSRVSSFLDTRKPTNLMNRGSIERIIEAGFHTVGFGVDGGSAESWKNNHKGQNEQMCIEAIRSAREDFGLTPETLMVFGHVNVSANDPRAAYDFAKAMVDSYGAIPRPHVSKWRIPGNAGWAETNGESEREIFLSNPELFQSLDFTALPSRLTHPNPELRVEATKYFLLMCMLPGNTTQPVLPLEPGMSIKDIEHVMMHNLKKYDR
ncbi:MAG: hypothetical protein AABX25_02015 [Nanoarchaeota archaeon]